MAESLLLYSTNSWMTFALNEQHYGGQHWVWCSPFFRPKAGVFPNAMPPSAIPGEIYDGYYKDIKGDDGHSIYIPKNKAGLIKGVKAKRDQGIITVERAAELIAAIKAAKPRDFRPLLYVIPFSAVQDIAEEVPLRERAHPLSVEYRIKTLSNKLFDAIELREV